MILLRVTLEGGEKGQCDARCYNARNPGCECVCCGFNHSRGEDQAITNTESAADLMAKLFAKKNDRGVRLFQRGTWRRRQLPLLDGVRKTN